MDAKLCEFINYYRILWRKLILNVWIYKTYCLLLSEFLMFASFFSYLPTYLHTGKLKIFKIRFASISSSLSVILCFYSIHSIKIIAVTRSCSIELGEFLCKWLSIGISMWYTMCLILLKLWTFICMSNIFDSLSVQKNIIKIKT